MKQTFKAVAMAMLMALMTFTVNAADFTVDGINYNVLSFTDFTCEVTTGDYEGNIVIPSEVTYNSKVLKVTCIGEKAFFKCSNLTSVNLPDGLTTIESEAFSGCNSLTSINFPNGLTVIEYSAFRNCNSITSPVDLQVGLTTIESYAFKGCSSITSVNLPEGLTTIGEDVFSQCSSLTSIVLPESLSVISDGAFSSCSNLGSVNFSNGLKTIGHGAFESCSSLASLIFPESLTYIDWFAFRYCHNLVSVELPEKLVKIQKGAFGGTKISSINLGPNLEELNSGTFSGCHFLSLTIPGNIKTIYPYSAESTDYIGKCFSYIDELKFEYSSQPLYLSDYKYERYDNDLLSPLGIKKLYLDRQLPYTTDRRGIAITLDLPDLEEFTLGKNIVELTGLDKCDNLKHIVCESAVPAKVLVSFTNKQYMEMEVRVPQNALEAYKQHPEWKNFWNLVGDPELCGIDDIVDSNAIVKEISRYDLSGRPVTEDYEGLVIVRYSDGSTRKVVSRK